MQQHIPTIQYALEQGARAVILMSTLGKPQGRKVPELSLEPIAHELSALLERYATETATAPTRIARIEH